MNHTERLAKALAKQLVGKEYPQHRVMESMFLLGTGYQPGEIGVAVTVTGETVPAHQRHRVWLVKMLLDEENNVLKWTVTTHKEDTNKQGEIPLG